MTRGLQSALAIVFVVVGLSKLVARELDLSRLELIANGLTFAPAPNPFRGVQKGKQSVETGLTIGCEEPDGAVSWHRLDPPIRTRLAGPHRRTAVFLHLIEKVHNPSLRGWSAIDRYLEYAWCDGGPFARAADCGEDLAAFHVRLKERGQRDRQRRVACPQR